MSSKVLSQIESALLGLARWRGWTHADRTVIEGMAANAAELNRRYKSRRTELHRAEGSRHAR